MRHLASYVFIGLFFTVGLGLAQPAPKHECDRHRISEAVFGGNLDASLIMAQTCLDQENAELESRIREHRGKGREYVDVVGLAELGVGTLLCVKLEILALRGSRPEILAARTEAETFDRAHPQSGISWTLSGAPLPIAKAFASEKSRDLAEAVAAYKAILADAGESRMPILDVVHGRLAAIAFTSGDYATAKRWSKAGLPSDPGANAVLGALLQKDGDKKGAKKHYEAALKLMADIMQTNYTKFPIYFAELERVKVGLAQVSK